MQPTGVDLGQDNMIGWGGGGGAVFKILNAHIYDEYSVILSFVG